MPTRRNHYTSDFKARLALEVLKGTRTLAEIASEARVHPNQLLQWKKQLLEQAPALFTDKRYKEQKDQQELTERLYQEIGQLKVELDWLKKKAGQLRG